MDYLKVNQETWNKRAQIHSQSRFYDVEGFKAGKSSLPAYDQKLLGDVSNKKMLHLQCHFGLDSMSWARLGAKVTGVDLSSQAIQQARSLAAQVGLDCQFVCDDVYTFGQTVQAEFDIVYTSYGVLCWMPDINKWAQTVAASLKPGGKLYLVEFHPVSDMLSGYRYFHSTNPDVEQEGTYTENCPGDESTVITWAHPLSDVVNALLKAGLTLNKLDELAYSPYPCIEGVEEQAPGQYVLKQNGHPVPLIYSIVATRAA